MSKEITIPQSVGKGLNESERRTTSTAFILLFPTLLLAIIAIYYSPIIISMLAIGLAIYQFLLIVKFIGDYYKK